MDSVFRTVVGKGLLAAAASVVVAVPALADPQQEAAGQPKSGNNPTQEMALSLRSHAKSTMMSLPATHLLANMSNFWKKPPSALLWRTCWVPPCWACWGQWSA